MGLDIRLPIGLLFGTLGILMVGYGFMSDPSIYQKSLGININVDWGAVMIVFGAVMLGLSYMGRKPGSSVVSEDAPTGGAPMQSEAAPEGGRRGH